MLSILFIVTMLRGIDANNEESSSKSFILNFFSLLYNVYSYIILPFIVHNKDEKREKDEPT